ncbi:DUF722 domain-containing protein [Listeria newyorkensis]|uniref:DUF722 domain-containing protein n=1 Tax=Listeria newyorkensis TaxID=1497681 RepID=A0A841YYQ1_9LIST|nr:DUF722 domain-containing protein [Listeria newyorkensis]MBC1458465.1 DUF722 domain-containing protein [Listeria newyorkensis]
MSKRLTKAQFQYIEDELRHYHETKNEMERLRLNVITGSIYREHVDENIGGSSSGSISNQVEQRTLLLDMDQQINRMKTLVSAIDKTISSLNDEEKQLVHFRYWDRSKPTWTWIAIKLNMSESTAKRKRKVIVYEVARRLGY